MSNLILHQTPQSELVGEIVSSVEEKFEKILFTLLQQFQKKETKPLTRKEAASYLDVSLPTLHEWTKIGKIRGARIGAQVRYRHEDIEAALKDIAVKTSKRR